MRRVVVTGIGLVTPLGVGADHVWNRITNAESGVGKIDRFDTSALPCQIAGLIPFGDGENEFNADRWISPKDQKKMDPFIQYGIAAAEEAIADSGWSPEAEEELENTGVLIGSGIGGLSSIEENVFILQEKGVKRLSPFFIPSTLINLVSGWVSMRHGFRGPNHSVVTACSTGAHAIGDATKMIALGEADVMVAGGTEAAVCHIGIGGFCAARALSTGYNDTPEEASRPWDKGRDGFVMGEGAGVVVLEEYEHAKARGAKIYGEVIGYGMSGDAHHITAPHPEGRGAELAMRRAFKMADVDTSKVGYVNAHGTSTPLGDVIEIQAISKVFGSDIGNVSISSTKSAIAHLLGAAGAVEAIFSIKAIETGILPPTLNLSDPADEAAGIDLVPKEAKEKKVDVAVSNAFGFGGTNACLIVQKA